MTSHFDSATASADLSFSPVQGGPLHRFRKAIGLVPEHGLGLGRRALALIAVAWLPVVVGAIVAGQALEGKATDPLLRHFGVHARFLLSVPLMIFAEAFMEKFIPPMIGHFVSSGLVDAVTLPQFREALEHARRVRDSIWGGVFVLASVGAVLLAVAATSAQGDEMAWAAAAADGRPGIGFAGWWYLTVSRPIFVGLLAIWMWRMFVLWSLVWKLSKLDLHLVASHPDGVGGLGFLEGTAVACAPLVLAVSVVIAGRWGHEVLYHGVHVDSLKPLVAALVAVAVLAVNGPLLLIGRNLRAFKRRSLLEYGSLVGHHGRLVYQKWIRNQDVGAPDIMNAPELGPTVDISSIYELVAKMRPAPISKRSLIPIVAAAVLPILPVFAIEIPIKQMLSSLAGALL
jgi:hypothetical protein